MTTPLKAVTEQYGSKEKLVSQLIPKLNKPEDESQEDFRRRLMIVSNRKLLKLANKVGL